MNDSPRAPGRVASYATALGVFTVTSAVVTITGRSRDRLADRYELLDVALGALATQKFSRMLAKDPVTTPIRAPFTEYEGVSADAELAESPRDRGHGSHTIGELLACPFCLAPWVAGGYVTGLTFAPRIARAWAAVFAMVCASDAMQHAYARLQAD